MPFLNEAEEIEDDYIEPVGPEVHEKSPKIALKIFRGDQKFFILGAVASVIGFLSIAYVMYQSSRPINLEDLPVIKADTEPIKEKPQDSTQVIHQDKIVYDNISGDIRKDEVEKIIPAPEEVISIPEAEVEGTLSDEEKQNIIQAFDELAPEKEYKINYIKDPVRTPKKLKTQGIIKSGDLLIVEEKTPQVKRADIKKRRARLTDFASKLATDSFSKHSDGIMVQVASLPSRAAADKEYNRLTYKNRFLKKYRKKIIKVDLGREKGIKYRLQVGPFKNRSIAQNAISTLKNNGFNAYIAR